MYNARAQSVCCLEVSARISTILYSAILYLSQRLLFLQWTQVPNSGRGFPIWIRGSFSSSSSSLPLLTQPGGRQQPGLVLDKTTLLDRQGQLDVAFLAPELPTFSVVEARGGVISATLKTCQCQLTLHQYQIHRLTPVVHQPSGS